jgi:hypothetical protein
MFRINVFNVSLDTVISEVTRMQILNKWTIEQHSGLLPVEIQTHHYQIVISQNYIRMIWMN